MNRLAYPAEIIELDWDIEADLGIDSIKKAQLFGELREFFDLESLTNFSLDHYKTLRDIAKLLEQTPGKGEWLRTEEQSPAVSAPTVKSPVAAPHSTPIESNAQPVQPVVQTVPQAATQTTASPVSEASQSLAPQQLQQFLIDFVVEQTGYPAEIVEMDADLEADLGIDSIKKAQLFGELREMFSFNGRDNQSQNATSGRQSLADYRTLRDVMDALVQSQSTATGLEQTQQVSTPVPVVDLEPASVAEDKIRDHAPKVDREVFSTQPKQTHSNSVQLCEWPIAVIRENADTAKATDALELTTNPTYREALASNLRAMVGRKDATKTAVKKNGNGSSPTTPPQSAATLCFAEKIAETSETLQQSILALDKALLTTCTWRDTEGDSIASLALPAWLSDCGDERLGIVVRWSGANNTIQVMPAGCLQPGAVIHDLSLLIVGGLLNASQPHAATAQTVLSRWISEDLGRCFDDALKAVRNIRVAGDWWLKLVDAKAGQQAFVESRDGVLVIERGTSLSRAQSDQVNEGRTARCSSMLKIAASSCRCRTRVQVLEQVGCG